MRHLRNILPYLFAPLLTYAIFCLFFQIWKIDLNFPMMSYNTDGLFSIFIIKSVIDTGWYFGNPNVGLPHLTDVFRLSDFPMHSDLFHILIAKFFSYFSDNPFFIANCFYITSFSLVSLTSFVALRQMKIGVFVATIFSILYAFAPYHILRGTTHLFLSNYSAIPLAVMVALWIASDKITVIGISKKNQYCLNFNKLFYAAIAVAIFVAANNIYYAYYSCVIFLFAGLLHRFKKDYFFDQNIFCVALICLTTLISLICLYMPTFLYQIEHGRNFMVAGRSVQDSELFGLRIIDMLLPTPYHYIAKLSDARQNFNYLVGAAWERGGETLGFIGAAGFMFLLLWVIAKNFNQENSFIKKTIKKFSLNRNDQDLISDLAGINILSVMFATVGGLVMFISIPFPLLRSHARFSIFIAYFTLAALAIICDKIIEKKIWGKKILTQIVFIFVMIIGLLDQVGRVSAEFAQSSEIKKLFNSDRNFIAAIEKSLPEKSMIFILPAHGFPEQPPDDYRSIIAYAHSKNLRWSYPAMASREADLWQKRVVGLQFEEFISELKKAGFAGVYINREQYVDNFSSTKLLKLEADLEKISKSPKMISQNKVLEFFEI